MQYSITGLKQRCSPKNGSRGHFGTKTKPKYSHIIYTGLHVHEMLRCEYNLNSLKMSFTLAFDETVAEMVAIMVAAIVPSTHRAEHVCFPIFHCYHAVC